MDGRTVVGESCIRGGDQMARYVLVDDRGKLRADVTVVNTALGTSYSEEWRFYGPGCTIL